MDHLYILSKFVRDARCAVEELERLKTGVPQHLKAAFRVEFEQLEPKLAELKKALDD